MAKAIHPCTCGHDPVLVEEPLHWTIRCNSCSAFVRGDSEEAVRRAWDTNHIVLYERMMKNLRFTMGKIKNCCKDPRNLRFQSRKFDLITYVCRVCYCRHRRMWAEPGRIFGR